MKLKILNTSNNYNPQYETLGSAGMDLRANLGKGRALVLKPLERAIIPTGLFMQIESGYEGQIRPRSGLAAKHGLTVLNAPGTIDSDFRGEVGVILVNLSDESHQILHGERIAQIVFAKIERAEREIVDDIKDLDVTTRGAGGYGSTGKI